MTIQITLTMGVDTGPFFDLYSNIDGFAAPFLTNVPKASLTGGTNLSAPDGATTIRVFSKGVCVNSVDITGTTFTTTTTTETPIPPTTTTSTTTTTTAAPRALSTNFNTIIFDEFGDYCPSSPTGFQVTASEDWYIQATPIDQHTLDFYAGGAGLSSINNVSYGASTPGEDTTFQFFWLSDDMDTGVSVTAFNNEVGEECD